MKILMLGWELPPHNSGGLGVACINMAHALAREGADIDFVIPYEADYSNIDYMHVISATHLDPIYRYGGGAYESARIEEKIIELKQELFNLRLQAAVGKLENTAQLGKIKKQIARMKTVLTERANANE